ncbi:MAG: response regulator [Planctomycetota bacterium]|nr:response regulator [Planctomycetota bacterium]
MTERVLIVDDDVLVGEVLKETIGVSGYECQVANNAAVALRQLKENPEFALLVADIHMPGISGLELLKQIKSARPEVEVIMVTGAADVDVAIHALKLGAYDFIRKPFEGEVVLSSVARAFEKIHLVRENEAYRLHLEARVDQKSLALIEQARRLLSKSEDLRRAYMDILTVISNSIEAKDSYTLGHTWRVSRYAQEIATHLGWDDGRLEEIEMGGVLHDIGKIGIPDSILKKPGRLSTPEYESMKKHPEIGAKMLEGIDFLEPIIPYILCHQERYDGAGYPAGLAGESIPVQGRLMAVADTFDAITSTRVYRPRQSPEFACEEIRRYSGTQFDPEVVDAFFGAWEGGRIEEILSRGGGKNSFQAKTVAGHADC